MFNIGSQPAIMKSVLELADSGLESSDSSADPANVGIWVRTGLNRLTIGRLIVGRFPSADSRRPIPVGRFQWPQNIKHV